MSGGSLIGGLVGGVVGFFIGGPMGAVYGASIGFGVGSFLDPMTPDMPSIGAPSPESNIMTSAVGDPAPDLYGTAKIVGHLLCYGAERSKATYSEAAGSQGGKGGPPEPEPQITGYEYYMSWVLGICAGPVDTLYTIYKNEDAVWSGELNIPASGGKETITIDGMGSVDFYFGTADQLANTKVGALLDDDTLNTPYRNYCWAFFDDCFIGNYARTPSMSFIIRKTPEFSFSSQNVIQTYDGNPMHAIYYALNKLAGLPTSWLDSTDFYSVSLTLAQEYRGVSVLFREQQSALDYIQSINSHIDNILRYGSDGKFHPKLMRDDYVLDDLVEINEDQLLQDPSLIRKSWIDTVNETKVQYTELINAERPKAFSGTLYWAGTNGYYRTIHDGNTLDNAHVLELVPDIEDWKVQTCFGGEMQGWFLNKADGTTWARGLNTKGQLGIGNTTLRPSWTQIVGDVRFKFVKMCKSFSVAISTDNRLYLCGENSSDILSVGGPNPTKVFTQELGLHNWDLISGREGRIGLRASPIMPILYTTTPQVLVAGHLGANGATNVGLAGFNSSPSFTDWSSLYLSDNQVIDIQMGNYLSYVAKGTVDNFVLYSTGISTDGQCGRGFPAGNIYYNFGLVNAGPFKAFSVGSNFVWAIKTDGTLWAVGNNDSGQMGQGDLVHLGYFTQIGTASNWTKVKCSSQTGVVLNTDGEIWGCGINNGYNLGIGNNVQKVMTLTQETSGLGPWYDIFITSSGLLALK